MSNLIDHTVFGETQNPKRVIVALHGMGQHPGYMERAARALVEKMPGTLVIMPQAPLPIEYSAEKVARIREKYDPGFDPEKARAWFATETSGWPLLTLRLLFNSLPVVHEVNRLADHYRDKYRLQDRDLGFFGMSQGGAIALYAAIARANPVAGVVSHSGMFFGFARAKSKPDVLMITGHDDDMLCNNNSVMKSFFVKPENGIARLQRRGIHVSEFWAAGLGHDMNPISINAAADFLNESFLRARGELPAPKRTPPVLPVPAR
jgi:predicted esterase